jgi:hypothetical protein
VGIGVGVGVGGLLLIVIVVLSVLVHRYRHGKKDPAANNVPGANQDTAMLDSTAKYEVSGVSKGPGTKELGSSTTASNPIAELHSDQPNPDIRYELEGSRNQR